MKETYRKGSLYITYESPVEKILTKEEILKQFDKLECELDRKTMDYLYSLYKLRCSALALDDVLDEIELGLLIESTFFKRLVVYNLYNKYKELVDESCYSKHHEDLNMFAIYSQKYNDMLYKLDFNYSLSNLYLFRDEILSIDDRKEVVKSKISEISSKIKELKSSRNPYRSYNVTGKLSFGSMSEKWLKDNNEKIEELSKKLDHYSQLTDDKIKSTYESDVFVNQQRARILKYVLDDCNLDLDVDFEKENEKRYVKKYGYANIHVVNTREI